MRLFMVRHGETAWNAEGRFQGQQDTELNERGCRQGGMVAEYLSRHRFDAVVSSPLKRALVTGEKIAAACRCETFETMDGLREINHGDWEGLLSTEVHKGWPRLIDMWHTSPHTVIMPGEGGESLRSVQLRAVKAAEEIYGKFGKSRENGKNCKNDGDVCVTTHDAVIKALLCHFLNAPLSSFWSFRIANCSLSIAELREDGRARVSLMGDVHYLGEGFDLPEQKGL